MNKANPIYSRKWTRMLFWPQMQMLKRLGLARLGNDVDMIWKIPKVLPSGLNKPTGKNRDSLEWSLIHELIRKYPDLQYGAMSRGNEDNSGARINVVQNFIKEQMRLMKTGLTREKAFSEVETKFRERLDEKIRMNQLTEGMVINNKARSFMTVFQQQAEYESRLKVLRMKRDLPKYSASIEKWNKEIAELEDSISKAKPAAKGEESAVESADEDEAIDVEHITTYKRPTYQIVNEELPEVKNKRDMIKEFSERSRQLLKYYYERSEINDRLNGLSDTQIMSSIRDAPKKIKKRSKGLLNLLKKHGVQLTTSGDVDLSNVKSPQVAKKLQENPLVKLVLLQEAVDFEFSHRDHRKLLANRLQKEAEERSNIAKLEETKKRDAIFAARGEKSANSFDRIAGFEYQGEPEKRDNTEGVAESSQLLNEGIRHSLEKGLPDNRQTYRLFETIEERTARLEEKWLRERLASLNSAAGADTKSIQEKNKQIGEAIDKLRVIKLRIDQQMLKNAEELVFKDHENIDREELLLDEDANIDLADAYLGLNDFVKRGSQKTELDDQQITKYIKPRQVVVDVVEPFANPSEHRLRGQDSDEFRSEKSKEKAIQATIEKLRQNDKKQTGSEEAFRIESERLLSESQGGSHQGKKAADKSEKVKLMDFIRKKKEASSKPAAGKKAEAPEKKKK